MQYRRAFVPGGSWFFTVVTRDRRPIFASADAVDVLRDAFRTVRAKHAFATDAIVVLPDHLHCIWTLPPGDADFATRWRLVKTRVAQRLDPALRGDGRIWQNRFWEHLLRDEDDFARHVDYIHFNPVKHGLVDRAVDWPHSSFHRYAAAGVFPADWGLSTELDGVGNE